MAASHFRFPAPTAAPTALKVQLRQMIYSRISLNHLVTESIRPYTVLWIVLGIGTAFKLARNAGLSY